MQITPAHVQPSRHARLMGQDWLDQIFRAKAAQTGGVVRRKVVDVEREIGRGALELEVRKRGFHLLRTRDDYLIICTSTPIQLIC